jgi:hypothetical protein
MTTISAETAPRIKIPLSVTHIRVAAFLLLILSSIAVFGGTVSTLVAVD